MYIYLMRHGTANGTYTGDEPSLCDSGRIGVEETAAYIKSEDISFDLIISSPKLRAAQTADIIAESLDYPIKNIIRTEHLKPDSTPAEALQILCKYTKTQSILCVGHLPSLPRLAASLCGISSIHAFPNATLYRLETDSLKPGSAEFMQLFSPE